MKPGSRPGTIPREKVQIDFELLDTIYRNPKARASIWRLGGTTGLNHGPCKMFVARLEQNGLITTNADGYVITPMGLDTMNLLETVLKRLGYKLKLH